LRPARITSSRAAVALSTAALLLLTTGCAARFERPQATGGVTVDQGLGQPGLDTGLDVGSGLGGVPGSGPAPGAPGLTDPQAGSGPSGTTLTPGGPGANPQIGPTQGPRATSGPRAAVPAGNTTGVTSSSVLVGFFVPKTGAAPVPPTIDAQAQNYFDYVKTKGGIWGRNVTVKIYDTGSTEAGARTAVQQAQADGIFAAVSLDRISVEGALVTALHKAGIPHLINQMPPGQAIPSDGFYIGTDQVNNGRQIADYMAHTLKVKKVGFVGETDPTAYPARDAFVARAKANGMQVVHNEVVNGMDNHFLPEAQKLKDDGAESVWMYVAPNNAINISKETDAIGYHPVWVSSSIAWGFNLVLSPAAGALDGAKSFSPWGGLSDKRYDTFNKVNTEGRTNQDKDIGLASWGYGQIIAAALKSAGPNLGRNSFRVAMQNLRTGTIDQVTGAGMCWPPLDFTGNKRYGSGDRTIVMTVKGTGANAVWATESDYRSVY
jgi:ABC-type branched-subunit amino acid transport system substrate-binding protein